MKIRYGNKSVEPIELRLLNDGDAFRYPLGKKVYLKCNEGFSNACAMVGLIDGNFYHADYNKMVIPLSAYVVIEGDAIAETEE